MVHGRATVNDERPMKATQAEMEKAGIDLAFRDHCAHLLIPSVCCCDVPSLLLPLLLLRQTLQELTPN